MQTPTPGKAKSTVSIFQVLAVKNRAETEAAAHGKPLDPSTVKERGCCAAANAGPGVNVRPEALKAPVSAQSLFMRRKPSAGTADTHTHTSSFMA